MANCVNPKINEILKMFSKGELWLQPRATGAHSTWSLGQSCWGYLEQPSTHPTQGSGEHGLWDSKQPTHDPPWAQGLASRANWSNPACTPLWDIGEHCSLLMELKLFQYSTTWTNSLIFLLMVYFPFLYGFILLWRLTWLRSHSNLYWVFLFVIASL